MEILVTAKGISKTYGARTLFHDISFVIGDKERIGLIGPNGSGKSTLLQILAEENEVSSGEVAERRGLRIGYLKQTPVLPEDGLVEATVRAEGESETLTGEILSRLDLQAIADTPIRDLSGGWKKRVALACELVRDPQLLLLDEPTNHLDVGSILWLEEFLSRASFATVTVTHDRLFLQRVATRILELDRRNPQGLLSVEGDYSDYVERKSELMRTQQQTQTILENKLRRETEWLRRGPKARTTKQQARINAAHELMDEVADLSQRNKNRTVQIDFAGSERKPKRLIEAKQITKRFGEKTLFERLDLFIGPGDRVGFLGSNGCGKTSLIRTLLGEMVPDSGELFRAPHLKIAYFEQNRESLDPTMTLKTAICPHGDEVNYRGRMIHYLGYLDRFLFRREQADIAVGRLSGGEQARLLIARLMLQEANILVLDEPTNDLDVETLDILEDCLKEFDGSVILVTHDRYFLDQVATQIIAFTWKGLITFASYQQWENWMKENRERRSEPPPAQPVRSEPAKKKRRLGFNETRELATIEETIHKAEEALNGLVTEAQDPKNASAAGELTSLYRQITEKQGEVDRLYARWAELEELKRESE